MADELPCVQLFTDGACSGNPGPGGWAFILRHPASGKEIERSGGAADTTNNRMELQGVIEGLSALTRKSQVELITDSEYVGKGIRDWMPGWKAKGWRKGRGKDASPVKNVDLWMKIDELCQKHRIIYVPVLGHAGHVENERCDQLAVEAAKKFR